MREAPRLNCSAPRVDQVINWIKEVDCPSRVETQQSVMAFTQSHHFVKFWCPSSDVLAIMVQHRMCC